jgi:hypothetical protein
MTSPPFGRTPLGFRKERGETTGGTPAAIQTNKSRRALANMTSLTGLSVTDDKIK